jgi:hypothetical protein
MSDVYEQGIFIKRTEKEFHKINALHLNNVLRVRKYKGIKSKWDFEGNGWESRTYDKIPKHKMFDFLRKAFEECEWTKIKKFKYKNSDTIYFIHTIFWQYLNCGYILKAYYYNIENLENNVNYKKFHIIHVKDVNLLENNGFAWIIPLDSIEILEKND